MRPSIAIASSLLVAATAAPAAPQIAGRTVEYAGGGATPPAGAFEDSADVEASGVLRRIGILCLAFETDAGELYALTDTGGFGLGDRVHVRGAFAGVAPCGSLIVSRLDNTIDADFAGTGTLVRDRALGLALETPAGARYGLTLPFGFDAGEDVFVRGVVRTRQHPVTGTLEHWIFTRAIGTPFEGFGRLAGGPGAYSVELETGGTLALDGPGHAFAEVGSYVFVEGALDLTTDPPTLAWNTARRALAAPGEVVDVGGGAPGFRAETRVFDDLFSLEDFGAFAIGQRGFVRGRELDDYDPLEVRGNLVRGSRIDAEYTGCGTLFSALASGGGEDGSGFSFQATTGETFDLETVGAFASEPFVFVSGAVDASGTALAHNLIARCVELSGTLQHGFECTPLFVADNGGPGASFVLPENLGPYWIGDSFCILGGLMACDGGCPVPCVMANAVHDCTQ